MKNNWIKVLGLVLAYTASSASAADRPNVVFFLVDDLGWTDVACYGSDLHQTPNVDALAAKGVRFTDAYAACNVCSPSRASLVTGKYPAKLHCTDWITGHVKPHALMTTPDWTQHVEPAEFTIAKAFLAAGYTTGHIGKWHLGETEEYWPENNGFQTNFAGWAAGSPAALGGGGYFSPYKNPKLEDGTKGEYLTERLAREAAAFIKKQSESDEPFFLNYWLYSVHTPLEASAEKIAKYEALAKKDGHHSNPAYAALVEHMDDALGVVMHALNEAGVADNTIVIFYSDNGGLCGNYENNREKVTSNAPLRSGKGDNFEGGVRVPLIISWPGKIKPGTSEVPFISPDLYPTLLSLTGVPGDAKQNSEMDGVDFTALLTRGERVERDAIYWHYPHYHLEGALPHSAVRSGDWKLIHVYEEAVPHLYNLKESQSEMNDVGDKYPEKRDELFQRLCAWRARVNAQPPLPNPNYDPEKIDTWTISESATVDLEKKKDDK